jgi:hypothetical protein
MTFMLVPNPRVTLLVQKNNRDVDTSVDAARLEARATMCVMLETGPGEGRPRS